ncbi:MAG: lysoplasmalogenase [Chloroflexota bacterium]
MRTALYLIPMLVVFVFGLIRAEILNKPRQIYFFKPISTLTVIAVALLSFFEPTQNLTYAIGVLVGLAFCFGGDVALMFQQNRRAFIIGLGLFLLGHIAYATTFTVLGKFSDGDALSAVVLFVIGGGFYRLITSNLGTLRAPVILYIVVISVMVNRAISTLASPAFASGQAQLIAIGAILFYTSDVILAANRFWKPWRYHRVSLVFYYSGQLLIALPANFFA